MDRIGRDCRDRTDDIHLHTVYFLSAINPPRYMVQPRRVAIMPPLRPLAIRLHKADRMHTQRRLQVPIKATLALSLETISRGRENSIIEPEHLLRILHGKV